MRKTWLTRIAVNVCKNMRKNAWFKYVDQRVSLDRPPIPTQPPSDAHITLTEAILRLPRKQMEALTPHYYQRFTMRETADILGISPPPFPHGSKKRKTACALLWIEGIK